MKPSLLPQIAVFSLLLSCLWQSEASAQPQFIALEQQGGQVVILEQNDQGDRLLSFTKDGVARLWNAHDGDWIADLTDPPQATLGARFNQNQDTIVTTVKTPDGQTGVIFWSPADGTRICTLSGDFSTEVLVAGVGGDLCITEGDPGIVRIYDFSFTRPVAVLTAHESPVSSIVFSRDGALFATANAEGDIKVWDTESNARKLALTHGEPLDRLIFTAEPTRLISVSQADSPGETIKLWDVENGLDLLTIGQVTALEFSEDGSHMVVTLTDRSLAVYDLASGEVMALIAAAEQVWRAALNRDGGKLATVSDSGQVKLWDSATGAAVAELGAGSQEPLDLVFSPDDSLVAEAGSDGVVRLWSVEEHKAHQQFQAHNQSITRMFFNPEGQRLVTTSDSADGEVRIWVLAEEQQTEQDLAGEEEK